MEIDILLPKLGFTMESGTISEWFAKNGDLVVEGAPLFALEGEKAVQEIEAPRSGRLSIKVQAGVECKIGTVLGTIEYSG